MGKPAKLYTAPTYAGPPLTIGQIAARAGFSYVNAYERIQEGKPVGGHVWQPTGAAQWVPAEPGTPERKRVGRGIPSRVHNGAVVDPPQPAAPAPERTQFGAKLRKEIVCWCEDCRGRRWTLDEIRACPGFPAGLGINGMTLRRVGQAVGHPLQYPRADGTTAGAWRKNGATPAAPAAPASPEPRGAWRFGTSPEAYDLFPTRERAPVLDSGAIGGRGEM